MLVFKIFKSGQKQDGSDRIQVKPDFWIVATSWKYRKIYFKAENKFQNHREEYTPQKRLETQTGKGGGGIPLKTQDNLDMKRTVKISREQ